MSEWLHEVVGHFSSISLPELQAEAELLIRRDRKYLVPLDAAARLLDQVDPGSRVLEIDGRREFGYSTQYFDDDHTAYFRALRRRPDRFKVRTRLYDDTGNCQLEVKLRDSRGLTVKIRRGRDRDASRDLCREDHEWLESFSQIGCHAERLGPCVATYYRRTTLVFPGCGGRMTLDRELVITGNDGRRLELPEFVIVETKSAGRPAPFDRQLWAVGWRPVKASKFALGVSLLHPELPANRWHRLKRRLEAAVVQLDGQIIKSPPLMSREAPVM